MATQKSGGQRYAEGTQSTPYRYAGQRLGSGIGLYDYVARRYDPAIGRFVQPDTVVPRPGNPQSLNRYSYVDDNPLRYTDPSGHSMCIDTKCDLIQTLHSTRLVLRGSVPPVIQYIYREMLHNAWSQITHEMDLFNYASISSDSGAGDISVALGEKFGAWIIWVSQVMDARAKQYVGSLAPFVGNWDHKPILLDPRHSPVPEIPVERPGKPRGWSTVGDSLYRFDIWSNIHYGYVGRAAGFSAPELTGGAGFEQIGSDLYSKTSPHRSPSADNWAASWDDPSDNAAIQVGIHLWDQYGLAVKPADLYLAVLEEPRLATQPLGGIP